MEITVTQAAPADLPAVAGLYGAVCDGLQGKPYNPGWRREGFPTLENAQTYLEDGVLLLARVGGVPAGSLGLTENPSAEADGEERGFPPPPPAPDGVWYIHVVAVHPGFARQGVASRLLAAAGELALAAGVPALRLYVWEGNAPAIRTYEKTGFAPLQTGVDIGLAPFGLERFTLYEKRLH